jgi:hypothetical protein
VNEEAPNYQDRGHGAFMKPMRCCLTLADKRLLDAEVRYASEGGSNDSVPAAPFTTFGWVYDRRSGEGVPSMSEALILGGPRLHEN